MWKSGVAVIIITSITAIATTTIIIVIIFASITAIAVTTITTIITIIIMIISLRGPRAEGRGHLLYEGRRHLRCSRAAKRPETNALERLHRAIIDLCAD